MDHRTPHQAYQAFRDPLQEAVSLVVPSGRGVLVLYPSPARVDTEHWIAFPKGRSVRLQGGRTFVRLIHTFRIVAAQETERLYRATTTGYSYSLLDEADKELLAYHYHPKGQGWCRYPHLHCLTAVGIVSGKSHLVTGRVALEAFVRMLIDDDDWGVTPTRADWSDILNTSQLSFERSRSWP